jgi:hypothetical protein
MNKILIFTVTSMSLLLVSLCFAKEPVDAENGAGIEKTAIREIGFMNILQAILNDPEFLAMSYPEQYKVLDDFYKHVDGYLNEDQNAAAAKEKFENDRQGDDTLVSSQKQQHRHPAFNINQ